MDLSQIINSALGSALVYVVAGLLGGGLIFRRLLWRLVRWVAAKILGNDILRLDRENAAFIEENARLNRELDALRKGQGQGAILPVDLVPAVLKPPIREIVEPAPRPDAPAFSPQDLVNLVNGQTDLAAQRLLLPHKGKVHTVTGSVREVEDIGDIVVTIKQQEGLSVSLRFAHSDQDEYFAALQTGMTITASGQLRTATEYGIFLEKCVITA